MIEINHFTSATWPSTDHFRDIEWEGRKMMAVQLPAADNEAWLIVKPSFWEQFTTQTIKPADKSPQQIPDELGGGMLY
jgi:calcineurin-like phosphoesterase family protein